jgi:hypothetical protein
MGLRGNKGKITIITIATLSLVFYSHTIITALKWQFVFYLNYEGREKNNTGPLMILSQHLSSNDWGKSGKYVFDVRHLSQKSNRSLNFKCRSSVSHSDDNEQYCLWDITLYSPFKVNRRFGRICRLPPLALFAICLMLVSCFVYLNMEVTYFSETSIVLQRTTWCYIPDDSHLQSS